MTDNEITGGIIGAAIRVHRALGPGLLESVYERLLVHELRKTGFVVLRQVGLPVEYEGIEIELGYRADLVVEGRVIVELDAGPVSRRGRGGGTQRALRANRVFRQHLPRSTDNLIGGAL